DKMVVGDGSIAVMYSGEVEYIRTEGKHYGYEYDYVLPIEGVNFTIDAWVIPKNSKHKDYAKLWIDFMLDKDIAFRNFEYMHYGIANLAAIEEVKKRYGDEILKDKAIFPDLSDINKYELYKDIGDYEEKYLECYKEIKSK
ncbi:MAG: extracellular solute-binding protein, partial [Lachnospiraceae bacterium]|nr:extracellular solute-binding protein [Lachnospiraceae bacterium]